MVFFWWSLLVFLTLFGVISFTSSFVMKKMRDDLKYVFGKIGWNVYFYDTLKPNVFREPRIEDESAFEEVTRERMERMNKTLREHAEIFDALFDELGYEFKKERNVVVKKKK